MTTLCIAGHGLKPDGSFDPGATGYIKKGEHRYMKEDLFPAMKRHLPKGSDVVFFSEHNVLHYGDLVKLANKYGKDTKVIEFHYDAFKPGSEDGHVIIWGNYKPDSLDLRLRDVIKEMVGLRFAAYGEKGISARTNLGNARMAAKGGVNYRLVELGFGTHKEEADILVNHVDEYARKLVEAILNTNVEAEPVANKPKPKPASKPKNKTIDQMATEVIAGEHGNGHVNRRKSLGISQAEYDKVSAKVNAHYGVKSEPVKVSKSIDQMAREVINGEHGNGHAARQRSLGISQAEYDKVSAKVNAHYGVKSEPVKVSKSIDQMAREVINGEHGNGHAARQRSLGVNDATYRKVRDRVNQLM